MIFKELNYLVMLPYADSLINNTLNNLIYDKFIGLCEIESSKEKIESIQKLLNQEIEQGNEELKFIKFLHEKREIMIKSQKDLMSQTVAKYNYFITK